jgi:hypothetical protein
MIFAIFVDAVCNAPEMCRFEFLYTFDTVTDDHDTQLDAGI